MDYEKYKREQELLLTEMHDMIGLQFERIEVRRNTDDDSIIFYAYTGEVFRFQHEQECCEDVEITDICGDMDDLLHTPLRMAEVVTQNAPDADESGTWSFYKFATINGYVDVRWYGSSNGYYGEEVTFERLK